MLKQKIKNIPRRAAIFTSIGVLLLSFSFIPKVARADQFQDQINQLSQENSQKKEAQAQLGASAATLNDTISKLEAQIAVLQAAITGYQKQIEDLQRQIAEQEAELVRQKKVLGESIKAMYLEGQITTLEMLASSKDLSEFVDKQQYRNAVQDKIKSTLDRITELKHQLSAQKEQAEGILKDKQKAQAEVDSQKAENQRLLSLNASEQATLSAQITSNYSKILDLQVAQAAANRARSGGAIVTAGDPGRGGYPTNWDAPVPKDDLIDSWGMFNRECVSYTAWKVYQTYGHMPFWGGHGNANQWPASAVADGISVGTTPRKNSVAIWMTGTWGHAMWVEGVNGDGTIHVSQYNFDFQGHYSEMNTSAAGVIYIYFN